MSVGVLVIDDEQVIRESVVEVLHRKGLRAVAAEDGERGLALFTEAPASFDVVVLDLTMQGLSGRQTLQRLRGIDSGVRVIICSGLDGDSEELRGLAPTAFLQKPFRIAQLLAEIQRVTGAA